MKIIDFISKLQNQTATVCSGLQYLEFLTISACGMLSGALDKLAWSISDLRKFGVNAPD